MTPHPYPPQPYPAYPPPAYPPPPSPRTSRPRGPSPGVVAAAVIGAIALVGGLVATCALSFTNEVAELNAAVDAAVVACAPDTGSEQSCDVPAFHRALSQGAASPELGAFRGFTPETREIRCHDGDCDARVRGRIAFEHADRPTTLDFVDHGDGWRFVSWAAEYRADLIP